MKYRVLLAGKNRAIVDDFFRTMDDRFECLTTSNRSMDMANHMALFKPHAFIYCFASESKDDIIRLAESFETISEECREVILIGDPEPCEIFNRRKPEYVKMVLHRPITANSIKDKLIKYFEKIKLVWSLPSRMKRWRVLWLWLCQCSRKRKRRRLPERQL